MSSNTMFICLVILNLLTIYYAYRIDPNNEPAQALFRKYEENINDEEKLANLNNLKQIEESNSDNYYLVPCQATPSSSSSYILCKKLDHFSRRDTGFLRFGRKR